MSRKRHKNRDREENENLGVLVNREEEEIEDEEETPTEDEESKESSIPAKLDAELAISAVKEVAQKSSPTLTAFQKEHTRTKKYF